MKRLRLCNIIHIKGHYFWKFSQKTKTIKAIKQIYNYNVLFVKSKMLNLRSQKFNGLNIFYLSIKICKV
jgi:hypothetical protein